MERPVSRPEILSWDWRGQPDLNRLARLVRDLSGGTVHLTPVDDTGRDEYALIVDVRPYEQAEATEAYLRRCEGEE
jgi:hypothetical protein